MTLYYAESNVNPLSIGDDLELPKERVLQSLRWRYGPHPTSVIGAVIDLLSLEPTAAQDAAQRLAKGDTRNPICTGIELPDPPQITPQLVAGIRDSLLEDLLDQSYRGMTAQPSRSIAHDASIYSGAAGSGLELLNHLDRDGVPERVGQLARFAIRAANEMHLPHGYYAGRTGVDVFLARAAAAGIDLGDTYSGPLIPAADWTPVGSDLMVGAAGVGLGHLELHPRRRQRLLGLRRSRHPPLLPQAPARLTLFACDVPDPLARS